MRCTAASQRCARLFLRHHVAPKNSRSAGVHWGFEPRVLRRRRSMWVGRRRGQVTVSVRLWLRRLAVFGGVSGQLLVACGAKQGGGAGSVTEELPCSSPSQSGCAQCCEEMIGPTEEVVCFRRSVAKSTGREGVRGYGEGELLWSMRCPGSCRPCAPCTVDRQQAYDALRSRGCDCTLPQLSGAQIDPCYAYGCPCICDQLRRLVDCGPTQ